MLGSSLAWLSEPPLSTALLMSCPNRRGGSRSFPVSGDMVKFQRNLQPPLPTSPNLTTCQADHQVWKGCCDTTYVSSRRVQPLLPAEFSTAAIHSSTLNSLVLDRGSCNFFPDIFLPSAGYRALTSRREFILCVSNGVRPPSPTTELGR